MTPKKEPEEKPRAGEPEKRPPKKVEVTSGVPDADLDHAWQQASTEMFERLLRACKRNDGSTEVLVAQVRTRIGGDVADDLLAYMEESDG